MSYDDFIAELGKAGLSVRQFADLLEMRPKLEMPPNSISNNRKLNEVPRHLAIIAALVAELHLRNIPCRPTFARLGLSPKKLRRNASTGKFGSNKQGRLEFGA